MRPLPLEARKDEVVNRSGVNHSDSEAKAKNVVVVAIQHHSPSLGEDKTEQRCVSVCFLDFIDA